MPTFVRRRPEPKTVEAMQYALGAEKELVAWCAGTRGSGYGTFAVVTEYGTLLPEVGEWIVWCGKGLEVMLAAEFDEKYELKEP